MIRKLMLSSCISILACCEDCDSKKHSGEDSLGHDEERALEFVFLASVPGDSDVVGYLGIRVN